MANYKVKEDEVSRLDVFLAKKNPKLGRSFVKKLTFDHLVLVNGEPARPGRKLKPNDKVSLKFNFKKFDHLPVIKFPIIYQDDDCIVINKPAGILVHSKGSFNAEPTVSSYIQSLSDKVSGNRAGIVHRLDRSTSGVMICAKNEASQIWLQKQFSSRRVKKQYVAIVSGKPKHSSAIIEMPIARNPKNPSKFRVDVNGKASITGYEVLKSTNHYSELSLTPLTGRTHQLRVHLSHIGVPIVGDTFYNGLNADRLYLHALSLDIKLLSGQLHHFEAKLPMSFSKLLRSDHE